MVNHKEILRLKSLGLQHIEKSQMPLAVAVTRSHAHWRELESSS